MVKLKTILLASLLAVGAAGTAHSQTYETDRYKFIPPKATVLMGDTDSNGKYDIYWWDRNKNNMVENNELFIDLNEDGIPDDYFYRLAEGFDLDNNGRNDSYLIDMNNNSIIDDGDKIFLDLNEDRLPEISFYAVTDSSDNISSSAI